MNRAAHGLVVGLEQIVTTRRRRCKAARLIVPGDSGLGVDELMNWCEANGVYTCGCGLRPLHICS